MSKINCLDKITIPSLAAEIKAKINDKMTDAQIREIGTDLALKHQEGLNKSLNDLRKQVGLKKSDIKVNDKKAERKAVEDEYTGKKKAKVKEAKQTSAKEIKNYEQKKLRNAVNKIDEPTDPRSAALAYFSGEGTIGDAAMPDVVKQVKRYGQQGKSAEAKARGYYDAKNTQSIDDIAHGVWEGLSNSVQEKYTDKDIKEALLEVMGQFNEVDAIRKEYIDKYGDVKERVLDDADLEHFQKLNEEELAAEEKEQQEFINDLKNFKDEFGHSNEFLESLIKKYNDETGTSKGTEIKDSGNEAGSKGEADKKISNREVDEKDKSRDKITNADPIKVGGKENTLEQYLEKGKAVLSALFPDHKITTYDTEAEYMKAEQRPQGSAGVFNPETKTISLNLELIRKMGAENTIFHEVIHPIVKEALESKPEAINEAYSKLAELANDPEMAEVWKHEEFYRDRGTDVMKIEAVTEFLTKVSDGTIDPSKVSKSLSTKIIEVVNAILKSLGISKQFSTASDLRVLADSIKKSFETADATALKEVLGERKGVEGGKSMDSILDVKNEAEETIKEYPELSRQEIIDEYKEYLTEEEINKIIDKVRGVEPPKPPVTEPESGEKSFDNRPKAIIKTILSSKNLTESERNKLSENLTYKTISEQEARSMAKGLVAEFGTDNAVTMAESFRFDGRVNSMIFAEAIDATFQKEVDAKTSAEKIAFSEQWSDYSIRYANLANQGGKFNAAVYDFYRKSPLGVVLKENNVRQGEFNEWFKKKEGAYKELFEAIKEEPEFKEVFNKEVESKLKEERAAKRNKNRQKIRDIFNKLKIKTGGLNSAIVPPQLWNTAIDIVEAATLAGESAINAIQKGVEHIMSNHKDAWDEKAFRKEMGDAISQIDSGKIKSDIDISETKKQRILDRFRKKLKGLTESQKDDLISKSFRQLVENKALEYDDFKKWIAEYIGLPELTPEEKNKIVGLVKTLNDISDFQDKVLAADGAIEINNSIRELKQAQKNAEKASTELSNIVHKKEDLGGLIRSITQLNTLGAMSLVKNYSYNIVYQAFVRFPKGVILTAADQLIYAASLASKPFLGNKVYKPDFNLWYAQKGYVQKGSEGLGESVRQLITGLTKKDYIDKEVHTSRIKPGDSWKDLWQAAKGEKSLSLKQVTSKVLQGTVGMPAEFVARMLNTGDKGFRYAAEGATARTFAQTKFGLKSAAEIDRFVAFPKETSQKLLRKQNPEMTDEQILKEAEDIEKEIIRQGEESVFQQSNLINDAMTAALQFAKKADEKSPVYGFAAGMVKAFTFLNAPFVKTPANIAWDVFNLVNPEVAIMQSIVYGVKAAKDGSIKDRIQAKKWAAHAVVGYALMGMAGYLAKAGLTQGDDEDERYNAKEEKGKKSVARPNSVNMTGLTRYLSGGSPSLEDGDIQVDNSWFGSLGVIISMKANKQENLTQEEQDAQSYASDLFERARYATLNGLVNSIFGNTLSGIEAIKTGDGEKYVKGIINTAENFVNPATIAQYNRYSVPYEYTAKGDSFEETMKNNFSVRNPQISKLVGIYREVHPQVTIWGDDAVRGNDWLSVVSNMAGFTRHKKTVFGDKLFNEFKESGNSSFFPPVVNKSFTVKGEQVNLTVAEHLELQRFVGQARRKYVEPFLNNEASIYDKAKGASVKYEDLKDTEDKIKTLGKIYSQGYDEGKELFIAKYYPQYLEKE